MYNLNSVYTFMYRVTCAELLFGQAQPGSEKNCSVYTLSSKFKLKAISSHSRLINFKIFRNHGEVAFPALALNRLYFLLFITFRLRRTSACALVV